MARLVVIDPGILSTVQDSGRFGLARYGVPHSGPMDWISFEIANLLVGNKRDDPAIEITGNFEAIFEGETSVSVVPGRIILNGEYLERFGTFHVRGGDILKVLNDRGFRSYLGLKELKIEEVLSSKSTCLPAKFGGLNGRKLMAGDVIECGNADIKDRTLECEMDWIFGNVARIVKGPQWDLLKNPNAIESEYVISSDSNRIGYRLIGERLSLESYEIVSEGMTAGAIQVPPDGLPIVMMADHPMTGGYSKIANVIYADLPVLGQKKPSDRIRFEMVDLDLARRLYFKYKEWIREIEFSLCNSLKDLYRVNVNGKYFDVEVKEIDDCGGWRHKYRLHNNG
ncbi:5-oxoprolinase subunit C family protein [Athalassotoga saccharophila]|uniref:5-oxoprolinase subunit C family protein n=1 Tax=Athalassotoga saccharophila TaxID=1441386 RepID=UPI00137A8ED6|nr:biotin-dependent carboxyltransferase family protein [Athalassotoga saccharophila]BBJ28888.1 allophanate hydrolase 2 subunit 2 [Athalassotoga saccharophila]